MANNPHATLSYRLVRRRPGRLVEEQMRKRSRLQPISSAVAAQGKIEPRIHPSTLYNPARCFRQKTLLHPRSQSRMRLLAWKIERLHVRVSEGVLVRASSRHSQGSFSGPARSRLSVPLCPIRPAYARRKVGTDDGLGETTQLKTFTEHGDGFASPGGGRWAAPNALICLPVYCLGRADATALFPAAPALTSSRFEAQGQSLCHDRVVPRRWSQMGHLRGCCCNRGGTRMGPRRR